MQCSTSLHEHLAFGQGAARNVGSHRILKKSGWADYPFSFHDSEELGPAILSKISNKTGLRPENV